MTKNGVKAKAKTPIKKPAAKKPAPTRREKLMSLFEQFLLDFLEENMIVTDHERLDSFRHWLKDEKLTAEDRRNGRSFPRVRSMILGLEMFEHEKLALAKSYVPCNVTLDEVEDLFKVPFLFKDP